jgi:hypothetical protein
MKTIQSLNQFLTESKDAETSIFEKRGKDLSPADAAKEFNAKVKSYGIKAKKLEATDLAPTLDNNNLKDGDVSVKVDVINIDPKTLGAMAPVFTAVELTIHAVYGESNQAIIMVLEYHWSHPSGSNGMSIRDSFWNGKWVGY